ncbi:MAG: terpene cyclase/mutase family protein [Chloroflexi bacterium]|uniref:Terpene cyclase/mutase family protein n=1 Tax=Candidatus Chlorohelix allophototropha TaxID=3003348 RepID=A0A8T7LVC9_9CHLR|nr:terpene cyclase/mutase family protein [Chloroflexota bacterium]WJW66700.1 terpene cyclase/mutase family protein [Chloroflexota bacterium L227-S17]
MGIYDNQIRLALDFLVKTQNPDGGWGYKVGGQSFAEPTALALLALFHPDIGAGRLNAPQPYVDAVQKGLTRLRADQHQDGGWGIFKEDQFSGWMTYLATWCFNILLKIPELSALYARPEDTDLRGRARGVILNKQREPKVTQKEWDIYKKLLSIDSNLLGWKWGPNATEAGFVIPTALAMIALTVEDRVIVADSDQIQEGKAYLRDRACAGGGWNVGNPYMYDKQLPPTPDGTAYALLAFAVTLSTSDFGGTQEVWSGVSVLSDFVEETYSDHVLALGLTALRFYPDIGTNNSDRLNRFYIKLLKGTPSQTGKPASKGQALSGGWMDSPHSTALAILALSDNLYFVQPQ